MRAAPVPLLTHTMIVVGLRTGLRHGELCALEWGDVDLTGGRIQVRRNYVDGHLGTPKSGRSREVPMSPDCVSALRTYRTQRADTGRLVFPGADGGYLTRSATRAMLEQARAAAGVRDHEIGWHILRHYPDRRITPRRSWRELILVGAGRRGGGSDAG